MKLTDEQIAELAPDWATHFDDNQEYESVLFESGNSFVFYCMVKGEFSKTYNQAIEGIGENSKPIPRKPEPFDITQHEWSDDKLSLLIGDADLISINDNCSGSCFDLHKDDVIALAKHFGLTAEDLK